jgi:hypothetical protein
VIAVGTLVLVVRCPFPEVNGRVGTVVNPLELCARMNPRGFAIEPGMFYGVELPGYNQVLAFAPHEIVPIAPPAPPVQTTRDVDIGLVV